MASELQPAAAVRAGQTVRRRGCCGVLAPDLREEPAGAGLRPAERPPSRQERPMYRRPTERTRTSPDGTEPCSPPCPLPVASYHSDGATLTAWPSLSSPWLLTITVSSRLRLRRTVR